MLALILDHLSNNTHKTNHKSEQQEEQKMRSLATRPIQDLFSIHNEMNRLFDNWYRPARYRAESENLDWMPVVDILEANEHVEIRAEIPGLSEKEVQVSVTDDVLTLKGEKTQESEDKAQKYHRVERSYGRFQRSFTLPANLNPEDIKAKFANGVLTVSIPKTKAVQPKEIQISVE